jgi:hypothetical protein
MAKKSTASSSGRRGGVLSNHRLLAVEVVLLIAWIKSLLTDAILASGMAPWAKVLVVMGATVGLLGGLFLFIEKVTREGVKTSQQFLRGVAGGVHWLWIHGGVLLLLFVLYARMLKVKVF